MYLQRLDMLNLKGVAMQKLPHLIETKWLMIKKIIFVI